MMSASKYYQAITTSRDIIQSKLAGKNHEAEDKMATKQISIAEELLNAVTPEPFTKVLCLLHDTRVVSTEDFKKKHPELMSITGWTALFYFPQTKVSLHVLVYLRYLVNCVV